MHLGYETSLLEGNSDSQLRSLSYTNKISHECISIQRGIYTSNLFSKQGFQLTKNLPNISLVLLPFLSVCLFFCFSTQQYDQDTYVKGGELLEELQLFEGPNHSFLVAYLESNQGYVWLWFFSFCVSYGVLIIFISRDKSLSKHLNEVYLRL